MIWKQASLRLFIIECKTFYLSTRFRWAHLLFISSKICCSGFIWWYNHQDLVVCFFCMSQWAPICLSATCGARTKFVVAGNPKLWRKQCPAQVHNWATVLATAVMHVYCWFPGLASPTHANCTQYWPLQQTLSHSTPCNAQPGPSQSCKLCVELHLTPVQWPQALLVLWKTLRLPASPCL